MSGSKLVVRRFPFRENVYNRDVTFLYGTIAQINDRLKRETTEEDFVPVGHDVVGHWRTILHDGLPDDYICLVRGGSRSELVAALAHECFHHTAHTMRRAGLPLKRSSEEAYAYYLDWILERCMRALGCTC